MHAKDEFQTVKPNTLKGKQVSKRGSTTGDAGVTDYGDVAAHTTWCGGVCRPLHQSLPELV